MRPDVSRAAAALQGIGTADEVIGARGVDRVRKLALFLPGANAATVTARMSDAMLVIDRTGRTGSLNATLLDAGGRLLDQFVGQGPQITRTIKRTARLLHACAR